MLLSTAYCPPLAWFALAAREMTLSPDRVIPSVVRLEAAENYQKQSYRNRCYIAGANGGALFVLLFEAISGASGSVTVPMIGIVILTAIEIPIVTRMKESKLVDQQKQA